MRDAADDAEIVHSECGVDVFHDFVHIFAQKIDFRIVENERVDMYRQKDARLLFRLFFDSVGEVVRRHDGHMRVNFHVHGRIARRSAVAVHGQIVDAVYCFKRKDLFLEFFYGFRIRRISDESRNSLSENGNARKGDEQRDGNAHVAVQFHSCIMGNDERDENGGRRGGVAETVDGGGFERFGRKFFGESAVHDEHEQFDEHGCAEHGGEGERKFARFGGKDLLHRLHDKLDRDGENDDGNDERGDAFGALVSEGVFLVGGFTAHFKAYDGNDVAAAVGEVVETVRDDGQRPRYGAEYDLARGKQGVERDADKSRPPSALIARGGRTALFFSDKHLCKNVHDDTFIMRIRIFARRNAAQCQRDTVSVRFSTMAAQSRCVSAPRLYGVSAVLRLPAARKRARAAGKLFSKQVFERRNIGDPFVAAPFGVDAVGLSERGVKFALGRAVDLHVVRLRPLSVPDEVSPADMDDFVAGGADRDDVLQFLDVFFVVVAPYFVRFQSSRPAAHAASAARARIGGAAQSVPHFFGKRASQVCIPAAVGDELKTQFSFIHAPILAHSEKKYNSRAGNKKAQIVG